MTRLEFTIDSPWWLMRKVGKAIKGSHKIIFQFRLPFTKMIKVYGVIDGITSFRLSCNKHEFGLGAFNFTLWILKDKNEI